MMNTAITETSRSEGANGPIDRRFDIKSNHLELLNLREKIESLMYRYSKSLKSIAHFEDDGTAILEYSSTGNPSLKVLVSIYLPRPKKTQTIGVYVSCDEQRKRDDIYDDVIGVIFKSD